MSEKYTAIIIAARQISKYTVLKLDRALPMQPYTKYLIDKKEYSIVPIYDGINCVAISGDGEFIGKTVKFI